MPKKDELDKLTGYRACTSTIPSNKGRLAQIKSNNYLRNTLVLTEAEERGYDVVGGAGDGKGSNGRPPRRVANFQ